MSSGGIVVDELVSIIKYQMDAHSKSVLEQADKASQKATKNAGLQSKALKGASVATSKLTGLIKDLGIVSGVTSGIMAAWSINAGKEASRLTNLSQATQVNIKELQTLGSVYEQLGGSAQSYAQDATAFFNTYGKNLDVEAMKELSRTFSTMAPDMAQHMGRAYGFSNDMIRVLMKGPDAIQEMTDKAERLGHVVRDEDIAALSAMNNSWNELRETVKSTSLIFQAGIAPGMKEGMDELTAAVARNQDAFRKAGEEIGFFLGSGVKMYANLMNGDFSFRSYVRSARNEEKERRNAMAAASQSVIDVEAKRLMEDYGRSEKDARRLSAVREGAKDRLKENPDDVQAQNLLIIPSSDEVAKKMVTLMNGPISLDSYRGISPEINAAIDEDLPWNQVRRNVAYLLAVEDIKKQKGQADLSERVPQVMEREFIGPASPSSQTFNNGDYANNSGNTSSSQTMNMTLHQQIVAPDPVMAAGAASDAIFTALNSLFPSHDGHQPMIQ